MTLHLDSGEGAAILYYPKFGEYGIPVLDGGFSYITLIFCPWCGTKLPSSTREQYFNDLEAIN